ADALYNMQIYGQLLIVSVFVVVIVDVHMAVGAGSTPKKNVSRLPSEGPSIATSRWGSPKNGGGAARRGEADVDPRGGRAHGERVGVEHLLPQERRVRARVPLGQRDRERVGARLVGGHVDGKQDLEVVDAWGFRGAVEAVGRRRGGARTRDGAH